MTDSYCPSYSSCRLIGDPLLSASCHNLELYLADYCTGGDPGWKNCRRYVVKSKMGFCPDFVLPDSSITDSEIIDRFDNSED